MYYRVRFQDVQIRGELLSWVACFKQFDAAAVLRHLRDKGLPLNCSDGARNPDSVQAEDWEGSSPEDSVLNGRILRGSSLLIGTFQVTCHDGDIPDDANPGTNPRVAPNPGEPRGVSPRTRPAIASPCVIHPSGVPVHVVSD